MTESVSVSDDLAEKFKEEYDCIDYLKTSAKTGENVDLAFEELARAIIEQRTTD
jgi:hypothetical protein